MWDKAYMVATISLLWSDNLGKTGLTSDYAPVFYIVSSGSWKFIK